MTKTITACCCLLTFSLFAQNQNVISPGGNYEEGSTGSMTWTIGEISINTIESPDVHLTQGFNQDWISFAKIETFEDKIDISIFPNPATHFINVVSDEITDLQIFDASNRIVKTLTVQKTDKVELYDLSPGIYYLTFSKTSQKIKTIKIIIL